MQLFSFLIMQPCVSLLCSERNLCQVAGEEKQSRGHRVETYTVTVLHFMCFTKGTRSFSGVWSFFPLASKKTAPWLANSQCAFFDLKEASIHVDGVRPSGQAEENPSSFPVDDLKDPFTSLYFIQQIPCKGFCSVCFTAKQIPYSHSSYLFFSDAFVFGAKCQLAFNQGVWHCLTTSLSF